ncbi:hypothetical protein E1218_28250 [Kribbella turkmenica]|uniref:DUF559 domain-containing protein n=1 Tax=Kribbella turkmenica TaxID=2530375 RepID=A0A4V2YDY6_9ACTN|nr:hypothetical protein E1218_28250 [Kribbella turkmenica]
MVSSKQAADAGYSVEQIRARLADGRWVRVRYGQYAERVDLSGLAPWDRQIVHHRRLVHAAVNSMSQGTAVVSHHSALVLHGVPVWRADLDEVQLTRTTGRCGVKAKVRHHRGVLSPSEVEEIEGLALTSVARATVETAARSPFEAAVVCADAAMRHPGLDPDQLSRLLETTEHWPGSPTIRSALAFADPLSESVGESRLRVLMRTEGLPAPTLQAAFEDDAGLIGRVDFHFPGEETVVEFDGMMKYADKPRESLIREKTREDRLRALGLQVVRIIWSDLDHPTRTAMRIRSAFARSRRTSLVG